MKKLLLALLTLALPLGGGALASTCRARVVVATPIVATPVVTVAAVVPVVSTFVPLVQVPLYSGSYLPPVAPSPAAAPARSPCEDQLDLLRRRLDALERGGPVPQQQPIMPRAESRSATPGSGKLSTVFLAKCARCHDAGVAATLGGSIVLTSNGAVAPINASLALDILIALQTNRMPKTGPKLTDQEFEGVVGDLRAVVSK